MEYLKFGLPIALSFTLGILFVNYLTVHPLKMSLQLFLSSLCLFAAVTALALAFSPAQLLVAVPLSLAAFVAGYALRTRQVLAREDPRPVPQLTRAKGDPGKGHTAVVYFTHGEPETYDPIGWLNQFREFDEQKISFVPFLVRPFFIYQLRRKYLQVGKSDHRQMHTRMLRTLEKAFRAEGDTTARFYLCFLDDNPRPDAAVIQALNDGASRIVVAEVFVTISNHTQEGRDLIERVHPEEYGATLCFTGPLWNSATLHRMFVQRANDCLGATDKSRVGVLLVGHGQPDEWDKEWPTETEQEILFRQEILKLFEADGYDRDHLSLAWMEFKEPKPAVKIEEFVQHGVEKILFYSAAISADSIHSQYDVPDLVHKARVHDGFPLLNLGAWNDDPFAIQAIKEKVDAQMGK